LSVSEYLRKSQNRSFSKKKIMNIENDQFIDNKELSLIIQLLRFQWNKDAGLKTRITELARNPGLDWKEFLRLVRFHKVYSHIYPIVKDLKCFPETAVTRLKKWNITGSGKALAITAELKAVNRLFSAAGVDFVVFKGQPLSVFLYESADRRSSKEYGLITRLPRNNPS